MKKLITLCSFVLIAIGQSNAQTIFTQILEYDKFDDVVSNRTVKTLVTQTDKTFEVETKGEESVVYLYMPDLVEHKGSRDSVVNLVDNVYGYETKYIVLTKRNIVDKVP